MTTKYTANDLRPGTIVNTPYGPGSVNYVRMAPPDYATVDAVSVYLESRHGQPHYNGTIIAAVHVTPAGKDAGQ